MRKTLLIARREATAYLASPGAYVIIAVFTAITGFLFVDGVSAPFPEATVDRYAGAVIFSMVFLGPALTMRLFAEERRLGTLDLLLSSPVSDWQVAAGKHLGALTLYTLMLAATLPYAGLLYWLGTPDTGPVATAYLGMFLYGSAALAVGLWASSLTANQAVAAVVGVGALVLLSATQLAAETTSGWVSAALAEASMAARFADLRRGVLDVADVVYYLSLVALFLFLAVRSIESRRWV